MQGESRVTPSIIDEIISWDIQGDQNEFESGVNRSIIDDFNFSDIERGRMGGESGVTRSIIVNVILRIWPNGRSKWRSSKYH